VGEEGLAVHDLVRRAPAAQRVDQAGGCLVVDLPAGGDRPVQRPRRPRGQERAERGEREPPVGSLVDDLLGREAAQHAMQQPGHGAELAGEVVRPARPGGERLGQAERDRRVEQLRGEVAAGEAGEPRRGGGVTGHRPLRCATPSDGPP
jgi:hypothetical protein